MAHHTLDIHNTDFGMVSKTDKEKTHHILELDMDNVIVGIIGKDWDLNKAIRQVLKRKAEVKENGISKIRKLPSFR